MDEYLIFHACIPKWKLEDAEEYFDENLVCKEFTLSDPYYCLEGDAPNYRDYEYSTELEVTKEGHLPSERWSAALEIAREWAGAEIAALTGKNAPNSREEAVSALRQFLAEKAQELDNDTIHKISNMLFALDKDTCEDYPFSEGVEFFEDWHYLEDTTQGGVGIENSVEAIAFVFIN